MSSKTLFLASALALGPTFAAAHMVVEDPYARVSSAMAQSGAAFMSIHNHNDFDDRLVGVGSDAAERAELHTHIQDANGVMRMVEIEDGIALPAGDTVLLERGGLHVMFLGLTEPLAHGDAVEVTLIFETSEPMTLTVPVDLERRPGDGGMGRGHGHSHGHDHDS